MGDAIDLLRKYVDKMDNPYNNKKLSKQIYGRIQESKKESESIDYDYNLHDITTNLNTNPFVAKEVCGYVSKHLHYQYDIRFQHKNIDFLVHIICEITNIDIEYYIHMIKWIICLCLFEVQNDKEETFHLNIFLTSLPKMIPINFPNKVMPIHINSGYSHHTNTMNVCIFRKEEWVKVLIHECFHAFNMDFHEEKINFPNLFQSTFFIQSKFLVFESFVEFWARILNCALFTYQLEPVNNFQKFHEIFTLNMNMERIYSICQASKLLKLFHLSYADVIDKKKENICRKIYKEDTNAFCYYIITSILMCHFDKTLEWFDVNNNSLFQFDKSERQVVIFCHYIKQLAKSESLLNLFKNIDVGTMKHENYMKMCFFDV